MLLRTRVSLLVVMVFAVVCVVLAFVVLQREDLMRTQFSEGIISDQATLWSKITDNLLQHMEDKAWIVAENRFFPAALARRDHKAIQRLGADVLARLREQGIADRFDVVYADGALAYSSHPAVFQSPIIGAAAAREAVAGGARVRGIGNDKERNIAVVLGIPLRLADGAVVGLGVYATDIKQAIVEMERVTNSSVQIVNRRGRLLTGSENSLWSDIEGLVDLDATETWQTINLGERVYSAVVLTQSIDLGGLVGRLIGLRDVTGFARRQERVSQITIGAAIAFLLLVLVALNYYLLRAFAPLGESVGVLDALSRGDFDAYMESTDRRDEVGHIVSAVDVFRANLIAVDRVRRSRRRRHEREERFIRRELTQLADTLDEDERQAVLAELAQLERLVGEAQQREDSHTPDAGEDAVEAAGSGAASGAVHGSDSLAMVATAFQKMSRRVQSQNRSLREALATKDAFIALQKELDIAARVQLSFLPEPMPPTETFEIAGLMRPAKEIGGDFYDFFRIDADHLGVVIADVSGKGVPAALFMAMARTLIRATAPQERDPGRVLAVVNDVLEQNNAEQLFVTVFYGVLDERSGRFTYANGGHNPPVISDRRGVRPLDLTGGVLLAMVRGHDYAESHVDLEAGARVILITDGVTEACNHSEEEFGDLRLLERTRALPEQAPERDVADIVEAVQAFAGEEPQFDDITCVSLRFKGVAKPAKKNREKNREKNMNKTRKKPPENRP